MEPTGGTLVRIEGQEREGVLGMGLLPSHELGSLEERRKCMLDVLTVQQTHLNTDSSLLNKLISSRNCSDEHQSRRVLNYCLWPNYLTFI